MDEISFIPSYGPVSTKDTCGPIAGKLDSAEESVVNVMLKAFATLVVILAFPPPVFAQSGDENAMRLPTGTGIIRGTVVDTLGGVPLARVAVRLQTSGQNTLTDDQGQFELDGVAEGQQELYVSTVDFILVKRTVTVISGVAIEVTIALAEGTGTLAETVTVVGTSPAREDPVVAAEQTLRGVELQQLRGVLANDPMRAVQVLPGVATGDDFKSQFSVRGAGVSQMNFIFEGISTPFLLHTVQQSYNSGSVAIVNGDVLDEVSLSSGSYPQRYGNRIGAELDFHMREGSRERVQSHVSVSAIDASAVVEGPLGASREGSWLVSARQSYLNLVLAHLYPNQNLNFGFSDVQAKLVYDVNARQQLQLAFTAGQSRLNQPSAGEQGPDVLTNADNRTGVVVLAWRSLPSPRFKITQRLAVVANAFHNVGPAYLDASHAQEAIYRSDWSYAPRSGLTIEGGSEARWSTASDHTQFSSDRPPSQSGFDGSALAVSGYAQARIGSTAGRTIVPGVRIDHWSLTGDTTASPWVEGVWPITPSLTLRAGGGIYRQEPGFAEVLTEGSSASRPERAYHADVGLEAHLRPTLRWQATVYDREDRDLIREPYADWQVATAICGSSCGDRGIQVLQPPSAGSYRNALDGHARGVECLVERRTANGLSGWVSYSLGFNRYHDHTTGESFWGDLDQRHTINAYANYRATDRLSFSARFRAGSNYPITGYWTARDGGYFVGGERNTLRVPVYSRLDVRMNRTFTWQQKRLTLFLEALNVFDRSNVRYVFPSVDNRTFQAMNLFEKMLPIVPSVGILLEF
jgi:hypothetical protein